MIKCITADEAAALIRDRDMLMRELRFGKLTLRDRVRFEPMKQVRYEIEAVGDSPAATLVMTIGDTTQVYVQGKVDEADIGRVRLGQPARIRVETFKDKTFNGKVTQISPMGVEKDNVTNFEVRVSIDNPGQELKANMTANAEIVLEEHADALIIPEAAITYDAQKNAFVEIVAPGAKNGRKKMPVKLGVGNGTKIQILDGLKQGDKVILPS